MWPIRFTLRDLLLAVALEAVGAAGLRLAFSIDNGRDIGPIDGRVGAAALWTVGDSVARA